MALYAEMRITHRPGTITQRVREHIGAVHDPGALANSRLAEVPRDLIDYAAALPTYRLVGFAASAVEYQISIETTEHDLLVACETVWRAIATPAPWGARPRLLEVSVSDETTGATLLTASPRSLATSPIESKALLVTGVLASLWLGIGLAVADSSLHDDLVVGASPPVIAALATFLLLVRNRRNLRWTARR